MINILEVIQMLIYHWGAAFCPAALTLQGLGGGGGGPTATKSVITF